MICSVFRCGFRSLLAGLGVLCMLASSGCGSTGPVKKMLSEDIETREVFANEIAILKNPAYRPNSREKFFAAKRLAEGVDFTLTRSVRTLNVYFDARDSRSTHTSEYGDEIVLYYQYGENFVRFRFWNAEDMISAAEVRVKADKLPEEP